MVLKNPGKHLLPGHLALNTILVLSAMGLFLGADYLTLARHMTGLGSIRSRLEAEKVLEQELLHMLAERGARGEDFSGKTQWLDGTCAIQDLSARLNLNWVPGDLLQSPLLARNFPRGPEAFLALRLEQGPFRSIQELGSTVRPESLDTLFTLHGPLNPQHADPAILARVQEFQGSRGTLTGLWKTSSGLNVFHAPPLLIETLIRRKTWKFSSTEQTAILGSLEEVQASQTKVSGLDLASTLGIAKDHPLLSFLGQESLVLSLDAEKGGTRLRAIVKRNTTDEPWCFLEKEFIHDRS